MPAESKYVEYILRFKIKCSYLHIGRRDPIINCSLGKINK